MSNSGNLIINVVSSQYFAKVWHSHIELLTIKFIIKIIMIEVNNDNIRYRRKIYYKKY